MSKMLPKQKNVHTRLIHWKPIKFGCAHAKYNAILKLKLSVKVDSGLSLQNGYTHIAALSAYMFIEKSGWRPTEVITNWPE